MTHRQYTQQILEVAHALAFAADKVQQLHPDYLKRLARQLVDAATGARLTYAVAEGRAPDLPAVAIEDGVAIERR